MQHIDLKQLLASRKIKLIKKPLKKSTHPDTVIQRVFPYFMQQQQQTNWCWSACATSVGLFLQTGSWTQCDTATGCLTGQDCCKNPGPCNVYGYLNVSLAYTKSFDTYFGGTITTAQLITKINMGYPVCARVAWSGGGAHFMAMTGYSYNESTPTDVTLYLQDSIFGQTVMKFSDFAAHYHSGGTWTHTYYTKPQT